MKGGVSSETPPFLFGVNSLAIFQACLFWSSQWDLGYGYMINPPINRWANFCFPYRKKWKMNAEYVAPFNGAITIDKVKDE